LAATGGKLKAGDGRAPLELKPGDLLLALLANAVWAFNFIAGKAGVIQFQPFLFTALRFAVLLLVLLPFLRWMPGRMRGVLGIALVQGVLHFSLVFAGLEASGDIASVAIASQLYVPFSTVLALFLLGETLDARRVVGIALAFGGVLVIGFDPVVFRHLDALLLVTDAKNIYILSGQGDVIEPDGECASIGSGGGFAKAAATALLENTRLGAREIAERAMKIAADTCIYTNHNIVYLELP